MSGLGTIINMIAIILGTCIGMGFGKKFSENMKSTIMSALGMFTLCLGIQMFLKTENSVVCLSGLVVGIVLGEWWKIEEGIGKFGSWLQQKTAQITKNDSAEGKTKFINGFLVATLLFCIGPVGILGSIQDGLSHNYDLLIIKSILDGISAIAFASTMGIGVSFSIIPLVIYQGAITLLAKQADAFMSETMTTEMTAVGGVILAALSISSLLNIKKIRISSMLPALFVTPMIVWLIALVK